MTALKKLQKEIYDRKVSRGFNVTDIPLEIALMYGELGEAFNAYRKHLPDLGEELADVAIYLLTISEILEFELENEIIKKMKKNKGRKYRKEGNSFVQTK